MTTETAYLSCTLCPRRCKVNRTQTTGLCGESAKLRVARAALHFWEEPCLSGTVGSGTVFFSGCGLKCVYCQNSGIAHRNHGREIDTDRLCEIFFDLERQGAANINLVTGTQFVPHIVEAITLSRARGLRIPILYNSSGYENLDTLHMLAGHIDIYLPDFKYHDPMLAERFSHAADYPETAEAAIEEMLRQVGDAVFDERGMMTRGVIVRHLVLPGHTEDSINLLDRLYHRFGDRIYISIMNQYTPCGDFPAYPELRRKLTTYEYGKVVDFARSLDIHNGFIQSGDTSKESFIPDFDFTGI